MAKSFREMVAWQLAFELKTQVILLLKEGPAARDFRFRDQFDETENHLRDGVVSSYFPPESVGPIIKLVARCRSAINAWHSYLRKVKSDPRFQSRGTRTPPPNRRREPS